MELVALQLAGIFDAFNELSFILKVIVFVYLSYWLFMTFRGGLLFGVALLAAAFFIFFYSISTTLLFIVFLLFVVFGSHLQFILDFGIGRILQQAGKAPPWEPEHAEQLRMQELERKNATGALDQNEAQELQGLYAFHQPGQAAQMAEQQSGQALGLRRRRMG